MNRELLKPQEAQAQGVALLNPVLLNSCRTAKEAVGLMVNQASGTHESIGNEFGKSRETVTRFANDNGGLKPSDIEKLILACGNAFFLQFLAKKIGCKIVKLDKDDIERAELEEKLARLSA